MGDFATFIANSWNHEDDMNGVAGDALNLTCFLVRTTDQVDVARRKARLSFGLDYAAMGPGYRKTDRGGKLHLARRTYGGHPKHRTSFFRSLRRTSRSRDPARRPTGSRARLDRGGW